MKQGLFATSKFLAHRVFNIHQTQTGIDFSYASKRNLRRLRQFLLNTSTAIGHDVVRTNTVTPSTVFAAGLSPAEKNVFSHLLANFSLKHATSAADAIQESGQISALRHRMKMEEKVNNRHTAGTGGQDESLYFVMGLGKHQPPTFVKDTTHLVTVDIDKLLRRDSSLSERFWLGNHLSEYQKKTVCHVKVGNAAYSVRYLKDNLRKKYAIKFEDGAEYSWIVEYQDELYVKNDVLPGVALSFLVLLRRLNVKRNPLVQSLYCMAENQDKQFSATLEVLFNTLMPGSRQLEAKIIGYLDISSSLVTMVPNQSSHSKENWQTSALINALSTNDFDYFHELFNEVHHEFIDLFEIASQVLNLEIAGAAKIEYLKVLINAGFLPMELRDNGENFLHEIALKDNAEVMDFVLSTPTPNPILPSLKVIPNTNPRCFSPSINFDVIGIACSKTSDCQMLKVLQKHNADFQGDLPTYINIVLESYNSQRYGYSSNLSPNILDFFCRQQNLTLRGTECFNELPLIKAVQLGELSTVRLLVESLDADVNEPFRLNKRSMLTGAVFKESPENGRTALHYAAKGKHVALMNYLLAQGANPDIQTSAGERAIDLIDDKLSYAYTVLASKTAMDKDRAGINPKQESEKLPKKLRDHMSYHTNVAILLTGLDRLGNRYVVLGERTSESNRLNDEAHGNQYCFPGGGMDPTDQSPEHAAIRELKEEVNVDVDQITDAEITMIGGFAHKQTDQERDLTYFYLIDIGKHPIHVQASDDFINARRIFLKDITCHDSKPLFQMYTVNGHYILGSNALLINALMHRKAQQLTQSLTENIQRQTYVEHCGVKLLINLLDEYLHGQGLLIAEGYEQSEPFSSEARQYAQFMELLNRGAIDSRDRRYSDHLTLKMTQANSAEGLTLLANYGLNNFSDSNYTSSISHHHRDCYASPLTYCAITNNLPLAKHLVKLGADVNNFHSRKRAVQEALMHSSDEMYRFLIDEGVWLNEHDPERESYGAPIPSLLCLLVKRQKNQRLKQLLGEGEIFVSTDVTKINRRNALITAIRYKNKLAARMLLATLRCHIKQKEHIKNRAQDFEKTALEYAQNVEDWDDIRQIADFINEFVNMNAYLERKFGFRMENFICTYDDSQNQTVHFVTTSKDYLEKLSEKNQYNCRIRQDGEQRYYIRMGQKRLASLFGSKHIANFVLDDLFGTVFWTAGKKDVTLKLQKPILEDSLETLSNDDLTNWGLFDVNDKRYLPYYSQIIKESLSINKISVCVRSSDDQSASFLLDAIKNNVMVSEMTFEVGNISGAEEYFLLFLKAFQALPRLKIIHVKLDNKSQTDRFILECSKIKNRMLLIQLDDIHCETSVLLQQHLEQSDFCHHIRINQQREPRNILLAVATLQARMEYLLKRSQIDIRHFIDLIKNKGELFTRGISYQIDQVLQTLAFQYPLSNVNLVNASPDNCDIDLLLAIFEKNQINQITIGNLELIKIMIRHSSFPEQLEILRLIDIKIETSDAATLFVDLIKLFNNLKVLDLSWSKFTFSENSVAEACGRVIASQPYLLFIDISYLEFKNAEIETHFVHGLATSKSLLGFKSNPCTTDLSQTNFNYLSKTCKKNLLHKRARISQDSLLQRNAVSQTLLPPPRTDKIMAMRQESEAALSNSNEAQRCKPELA